MYRCRLLVVHRTNAYACLYYRVSSAAIQHDRRVLSFVSLQTKHQSMITFPTRLCPIVRAKPSTDTYYDIVSCGTKEAYSLASFLTIFGNVLAFLDGSLVGPKHLMVSSSLFHFLSTTRRYRRRDSTPPSLVFGRVPPSIEHRKRLKALTSPRNPIC